MIKQNIPTIILGRENLRIMLDKTYKTGFSPKVEGQGRDFLLSINFFNIYDFLKYEFFF